MKHHPSQEAVSGVPMRNYFGSGQFIVYRNCLNLLSPEEIMPPWDGAHFHARRPCPPGLAVIFYVEGSFLERLLCDGEQCRHRLGLIFVELRIRRGIDHRLNQYLSIPTGIYRHPLGREETGQDIGHTTAIDKVCGLDLAGRMMRGRPSPTERFHSLPFRQASQSLLYCHPQSDWTCTTSFPCSLQSAEMFCRSSGPTLGKDRTAFGCFEDRGPVVWSSHPKYDLIHGRHNGQLRPGATPLYSAPCCRDYPEANEV